MLRVFAGNTCPPLGFSGSETDRYLILANKLLNVSLHGIFLVELRALGMWERDKIWNKSLPLSPLGLSLLHTVQPVNWITRKQRNKGPGELTGKYKTLNISPSWNCFFTAVDGTQVLAQTRKTLYYWVTPPRFVTKDLLVCSEMRSHYLSQAGLTLLGSSGRPASATWILGL